MKEEIMIRIFSAVTLSAVTGSILFLYWKILCKCFMNQGNQRVFEIGIKITLLCYYVPIIYIALTSWYEDGFLFDIPNLFYKKLINLITIVWIIGVIVSFGMLGRRIYKLGKMKKRCFESKQWMKHTLETCKREMKIQKEINLFMGYQINVPMIAGFFHPCIFLPVKEFTEEELEICLYHELNHYKKHDILWNYLSSGIVCIHWYFPLVRKVWRDMDQWSEISCDIRSIAYVGSMKKYFSMILKMSEETSGFQTYTMACLFENTSLLEKRMIYVRRYISRGRSKVIFMFILLFIFFMAGGVSIYAMTDKYHDIYVDWVQEKTVEVEEFKDNNPSYKKMKEMKGKLRKDQVEKIVKANLKGDEMIPINHTIGANGRILYKNIYVKKGQKIDISTARSANNHKIRIGISCDDKEVRYVEDEGEDEVSHIFNINYEGKYDVYVENMSDKKIKIIGVLAIMLEGERE